MHAVVLDNTNLLANSPETCLAKSIPYKSIQQQVVNSLDANKALCSIF